MESHRLYKVKQGGSRKVLYNVQMKKMKLLFGNTSDIFIPSDGLFNNSTLEAMSPLGFKILSGDIKKYTRDIKKISLLLII